MGKRKAFTLIELLVVIAIIALLMSILMPALSRVKNQARKVACQGILKQWGLFWKMYCDDNNGFWLSGLMRSSTNNAGSGRWWFMPMLETYQIGEKMRCCPQATKPLGANVHQGIGYWAFQAWQTGDYIGSYGPNGWMCNVPAGRTDMWGRSPVSEHWRTPGIDGAWNVPLFTEGWWVDFWPRATDQPPSIAGGPPDSPNVNEMNRVLVDRHSGFLNGLFCDWSVRTVGLKELWTLKWSKTFNTRGVWTKMGGADPVDWPDWMRHYKDY